MTTRKVSRCVKCGGTELPEVDHVLPMTIAGQKFELAGVMQVCANCHEAYLEPELLERFEKRAALELARAGVRTAEAVRFMRKGLGMRAQDFAELIGQTAENVSRVENGKVPPDVRTVTILGSLLEDQENGTTATLDRLRALRGQKRSPRKILVSFFRTRKGQAVTADRTDARKRSPVPATRKRA